MEGGFNIRRKFKIGFHFFPNFHEIVSWIITPATTNLSRDGEIPWVKFQIEIKGNMGAFSAGDPGFELAISTLILYY